MRFSVFKHRRKVNGRKIARLYSGRYRLKGESKSTYVPLDVTDKQLALQKLAEIVRERQDEQAGSGAASRSAKLAIPFAGTF